MYYLDKHSLTYWTFAVTLTLNVVIQFFHRTLQLMMLNYQTRFGCKWTSSLEDIVEIVIFWLYKPMLWPWHWRQWTNLQQRHWQGWNQFGMTGVFCSVPRYNWCAPLSHPSSFMHVNHGPSKQSSVEEYKLWKWSATTRYYASHTLTMLPTRKSVPRSSRQLDHMKTSSPL